jgi:hypothetical protein
MGRTRSWHKESAESADTTVVEWGIVNRRRGKGVKRGVEACFSMDSSHHSMKRGKQ